MSESRIRKRRIVERPRLFALLDQSKARVRMLIAPAGYGKTTLAEQWVARDGRVGVWYTARSASTDVAALALGIARAATSVVEGCDHRLREHLRALPAPAENVQTLAEILGEDLAEWPENAWLVLDDYHEVTEEPRAEEFVAALIAESPIQCLIGSRLRPAWISTKWILYGDALELNQTALAMDNREAADVLVNRSGESASGLVSLAHGWPAVIGLAAVSSAELGEDSEPVPRSLYNFFAEEVFSALSREVQQGLTTVSVAPLLDHGLVNALLGHGADDVVARALDVGILVERNARLDLHPLARAFLEEKQGQLGLVPAEGAGELCLAHYRDRGDWDAAFEVIMRDELGAELETLLAAAMDDLLATARLPTLERWCDFAFDAGLEAPTFSIARAEVLLREGHHLEAIAHAESAANSGYVSEFRALCLAGRAAHLASREEQALELFQRAMAAASDDRERQDALWGQLMALIDLERPEADEALRVLRSSVQVADPREVVRAAAYGLSHQFKLGCLDLEEADYAATLLSRVRDPLVVSSFQSAYSGALVLVARYDDAKAVAESFRRTIDDYRLDFAIPYAHMSLALAAAGMRRWTTANAAVTDAVLTAERARDDHAHQLCLAIALRILAQQGRHNEALQLELPAVRSPLPAAQADVVASRALVLASAGRIRAAQDLIREIRGLSKAVEPTVLTDAVEAICALKEHSEDVVDRVARLEMAAFERGALDLLVTAYRSTPELLTVLLRTSKHQSRLVALIRRVRDDDLAEIVGLPVGERDDPRHALSPRERDVYELLVQRLRNREIAKLLYIEESTVKVHVHHIYDKLGVRSRSALAVQAALERSAQATSAMDETSDAEGSSEA